MYCFRTFFTLIYQTRKIAVSSQRICSLTKYTSQLPRYYAATTSTPGVPCSSQIEDIDQIVVELTNGDAELEKKLRILMLEVEVMRQDGRYAPDHIRKDQWAHLLELQSRNQRNSYLRYLFKSEKAKENCKAKREARRKENPVIQPEDVKEYDDDLLYSIKHQSLFLRIRDQSINQFDNYRALQAMMYGQSLVIDCSYDGDMVFKEAVNAAKQMTYVFGDNRIHKQPFNLHMCNLNMESQFMKSMRRNIPSLDEPWFPMNFHLESYMDIFPKEKLVYLTPHCRDELTKFDHDAVYIIGCMVDKLNTEPLSLIRAKRDGIKMAKLPLDRYLEWAPGSRKTLNINHMVPILLDLKLTGDWEYSLRHIPRRKLMETKIKAMERKFAHNPELKNEILKSFKSSKFRKINNINISTLSFREKKLNLHFKEKQTKTKSSLYDDDNI